MLNQGLSQGLHQGLLHNLMEQFQKLPGIGPKTAQRLALHVINWPADKVQQFADCMVAAKLGLKACERCFHLTDKPLCELCTHPNRQTGIVCVVADPRDVLALEKTAEYRGLYHVLGGVISPLEGIGPEQLTIRPLLHRLTTEAITEIILALPPSIEGDTTSLYLTKCIQPLGIMVSRIAFGLPAGGELEYADQLTISRALAGRTPLSV
jgi:recombination protein RecR